MQANPSIVVLYVNNDRFCLIGTSPNAGLSALSRLFFLFCLKKEGEGKGELDPVRVQYPGTRDAF